VSHGPVPGYPDVLATDGLKVLGTLGFFVPAAILIGFVVFAVIRDRRRTALEEAEEGRREGSAREEIPTPPPAD
jgi:flagellar biosynthesis/type III secretory pathway M-ring protein FliF/YscJ